MLLVENDMAVVFFFYLDGFSKLHQSQQQNLVSMNNPLIQWRVVPAMLIVVRLHKN